MVGVTVDNRKSRVTRTLRSTGAQAYDQKPAGWGFCVFEMADSEAPVDSGCVNEVFYCRTQNVPLSGHSQDLGRLPQLTRTERAGARALTRAGRRHNDAHADSLWRLQPLRRAGSLPCGLV